MPTIPDPILNNLKCVNCKYWLSCGPLRLLANGGSICGRCEAYDKGPKDQYRHFAFEALACYFKFPCKNWENNCPEILSFKKVLEHERNCRYGSGCSIFFSHPSAAFKSKRHLDVKAAIKLEVIPDVVLEYLRCTNCAGYLSCAPVYVCRDGTSICHRCNTDLPLPNSEFIQDLSFEAFVDIIIFPCIFRTRGCTQMFKFGDAMKEHEIDCPYGQPYVKEQHTQAESKRDSTQLPHKERGVIQTHSGHIYATITPNAPLFSSSEALKKHDQAMLFDEFERHRENLASKWGMPDDDFSHPESSNGNIDHSRRLTRMEMNGSSIPADSISGSSLNRTDSVYDNTFGNPILIKELKIKQQIRKHEHERDNAKRRKELEMDDTYNSEKASQNMGYSVYS